MQSQGYTVRMQRRRRSRRPDYTPSAPPHPIHNPFFATYISIPVNPWPNPIPLIYPRTLGRCDQLGPAGVVRPESVLSLPLPVLFSAIESASLTSSGSCSGVFPSHASWMSDIVLSRLRRRVLGLVMVVPKLAWRPCPRRNGDAPADIGDVGEMGDAGDGSWPSDVLIGAGSVGVLAMTCSRAAATPFGDTGGGSESSAGVVGWEEMRPFPSSDSGSYRSGGKRSFSMSDFRLR